MRRIAIVIAVMMTLLVFTSTANAATEPEIQASIELGLAWLAAQQDPATGSWGAQNDHRLGITGLVVKKFEHDAMLRGYNSPFDPAYPYHANVENGLNFILGQAEVVPISMQTAGDPDTDGDGIGVRIGAGATWHPQIYSTGIALMAIAESMEPNRVVPGDIGSAVAGWTYYDVAVDIMNYLAFGQVETGNFRGGWRYYANYTSSDQSNSGYATLGLGFAEASPPNGFSIIIPQWVKDELGNPAHTSNWIDWIQYASGGSGYDGRGGDESILGTGNLVAEMAFYGDPLATPRVQAAISYIALNWHVKNTNTQGWPAGWINEYQAMFTMMKGLEAYNVTILNTPGGPVDWFDEVSDSIVARQAVTGQWPPSSQHTFWAYGDPVLSTVWALLTLQKVQPHDPYCADIKIEKVHDALQGHFTEVSITIENSDLEMGGFDFLIAYDASALTFMEAEPGQLLEDCGWEYFTYRYGVDGNCGDACPSGLLRIIAIAETNNGPNHPACFGPPDTDPHELAQMRFFVTNDRTYECQYVPIYFFWDDCNDNAISSIDGSILYIDRAIYDFEDNLIWDEDDDDEFPEDERIPFVGAPDFCLNPDPEKPTAERCIKFIEGGIDIVCADSIDLRGDINCNGIPNEIADVVMYGNYFIEGLSAFGDHIEASIAASDVNADGMPLSVADLVYMIRVVVGDANPYAKALPYDTHASVSTLINHSAVGVLASSVSEIGGGYFVFNHSGYHIGEPHLINGASDMTLKFSNEGGVIKVLVYSMEKGVKIPAGTQNIFAIPISGEGIIDLVETELSDYYGNLLAVTIGKQSVIPKTYSLHQNYPNPFNAATTIIYELPDAAHVTIDVFNVIGQKVSTLFDGQESAGVHSIAWDGADESGRTVSSGVYFYRITSPGFTAEKKMVLMK